MTIGLLSLKLYISDSLSLKDKRMVLKSLKDRLRGRFNVSVAEVDDQDKWQSAVLAVCLVTTDKAHADSSLAGVLNFVEDFKQAEILDHQIELL